MPSPTEEQLSKLPRWAQQHIKDLSANNTLLHRQIESMETSQVPAPCYVENYVVNPDTKKGKFVRTYLHGYQFHVSHNGITVSVQTIDKKRLVVSWSAQDSTDDVAVLADAFNTVRLVRAKDMRFHAD